MSYFISGAFTLGCRQPNHFIHDVLIDDNIVSFQKNTSFIRSSFSDVQINDELLTAFTITSQSQPYNSESIIYPYDDYSHEELFPMGDDNVDRFLEICKTKLTALKKILNTLFEQFEPDEIFIIVSDGDDDGYEVLNCNVEQFIDELYRQVKKTGIYKSQTYRVRFIPRTRQ